MGQLRELLWNVGHVCKGPSKDCTLEDESNTAFPLVSKATCAFQVLGKLQGRFFPNIVEL